MYIVLSRGRKLRALFGRVLIRIVLLIAAPSLQVCMMFMSKRRPDHMSDDSWLVEGVAWKARYACVEDSAKACFREALSGRGRSRHIFVLGSMKVDCVSVSE